MICITLQEDADAVRLDSLLDFKKQHFFARPYSSSENNYFFGYRQDMNELIQCCDSQNKWRFTLHGEHLEKFIYCGSLYILIRSVMFFFGLVYAF